MLDLLNRFGSGSPDIDESPQTRGGLGLWEGLRSRVLVRCARIENPQIRPKNRPLAKRISENPLKGLQQAAQPAHWMSQRSIRTRFRLSVRKSNIVQLIASIRHAGGVSSPCDSLSYNHPAEIYGSP